MSQYENMFVYSLGDVLSGITRNKDKLRCVGCGKNFNEIQFGFYEHDGGILALNTMKKYWIYVRCVECGYSTAIWKFFRQIDPSELGIQRLDSIENRLIVLIIDRKDNKICVCDVTLDTEFNLPMSGDLNMIKDINFVLKHKIRDTVYSEDIS